VLDAYRAGTDELFVSQARSREDTFGRSLDMIERCRNGIQGRVLDVGTAGGAFLAVAQRRGWEVEGCEPSRWLCDWAAAHYGIAVKPGTLAEQNYPDSSFDVVTLWDVLEHSPDPLQLLVECRRVLKPGGLLILTYPDIGSAIARLMGRSWVFLLSVHLYYFTRATMGRLLARAGFAVEMSRAHFQQLELGYVLHRATPYVGRVATIAAWVGRRCGLEKRPISYWMGQTFAVARKMEITAASISHKVQVWAGSTLLAGSLAQCT
jgi:SAM-dependent methyltransferase